MVLYKHNRELMSFRGTEQTTIQNNRRTGMEKEKQKFDLMGTIDNLVQIEIVHGATGNLTVNYPTEAVFEAQKAWMEDKLKEKEWIKGLEDGYRVKVIDSGFICNGGKYSLSIIINIPRIIRWDVIQDGSFLLELFTMVRKYFAERIVVDYPLPFSPNFNRIPLKPYVKCKYCFSYHHSFPAAIPRHAISLIAEEKFRESMKEAINANGGFFLDIRIGKTRKNIPVAYLELTRRMETSLEKGSEDDDVGVALSGVLSNFFGDRMALYPCCEKDID
ncbi:MAG: hypothetical protein ACD_15C00016G0001 [uncultured bacterium]|nr:MAG: hypothetical protein ACD_15C00016G0001 [uncultured bacterium]